MLIQVAHTMTYILLRQTITGASFSSTSSTKTVTVNCGTAHGLRMMILYYLIDVTGVLQDHTYTNATFDDVKYMVTSVPTTKTFTITAV